LPTHSDIVTDHQNPSLTKTFTPELLGGQSEMKGVTGIVHYDHQSALVFGNQI
jgi:hypothetical protein